jgi:hypothetical protein
MFLMAVTCFVGGRMPALAGDKGKDKDKKQETKAGEKETKAGEKKEQKQEEKKGETAKPGEKAEFKAFDPSSGPFFQEVDTNTTQKMKVMGQDVTQVQEQKFYIEWTPLPKDKDGNFEVKQKVKAVKMKIDIGGNTINFDSTADPAKQPKNPMTDFFNALLKQELVFVVSPNMEIKAIKGRDEFIKSLSETNPAIKTLLDTIMKESALKQMAEPTWWAVPRGEKTWTRNSKLELGPIGDYDTTFKFTDEGADGSNKDREKIKIEADLKYTAPPKDRTGLPFTIKSAKLESKGGSGEAIFDRTTGRIASSKLTMQLEGNLQIEVGNMATDISLNQTQTSTTRTASKYEDLLNKK